LIDFAKKFGNLDKSKWNKNKIKGKIIINPETGKKLKKHIIPASALSTGQLSYLAKIEDYYNNNKNVTIIKVPRKKGESNKKYSARLREIKKNSGQENSPLKMPALHIPKSATFKTTPDNRLQIFRDFDYGKFREEIFPLEGREFIEIYDGDYLGLLIDFVEKHDLYSKLNNYADIVLSLQCGNSFMRVGYSITDLQGFADKITSLMETYITASMSKKERDKSQEERDKLADIIFTAITVKYYPK